MSKAGEKDPSFPFYASDFLGSSKVALMNLEEQGAYVRLLCHQWADSEHRACSLPCDDKSLAALSGLGSKWKRSASVIRKCFESHPTIPGRITNMRLHAVWLERQEWREKSAEAGRKSGIARRDRKSNRDHHEDDEPNANQQPNQPTNQTRTNLQPNTNSPLPLPLPSSQEELKAASEFEPSRVGAILAAEAQPGERPEQAARNSDSDERAERERQRTAVIDLLVADMIDATGETDGRLGLYRAIAARLPASDIREALSELRESARSPNPADSLGAIFTDNCKRKAAQRHIVLFPEAERRRRA